jgi:hypothetical protein
MVTEEKTSPAALAYLAKAAASTWIDAAQPDARRRCK